MTPAPLDVSPDRRCARCGDLIPPLKASGRPPTFCSAQCRLAHRSEVQHFEKRVARQATSIEHADAGLLQWSPRHRMDMGDLLAELQNHLTDLRRSGGTPHQTRN